MTNKFCRTCTDEKMIIRHEEGRLNGVCGQCTAYVEKVIEERRQEKPSRLNLR